MNKGVRSYAATSSMLRPEIVEIKNTIKTLRKDAEMRLTLDVEAQQSFEFLSDQVRQAPCVPPAGCRHAL